jgi:hypothetical protein
MCLWQPNQSEYAYAMMLSLYVTLGTFFAAGAQPIGKSQPDCLDSMVELCSVAAVMAVQAFKNASERGGFLGGVAALGIIGVALIALAPEKQPVGQASVAGAWATGRYFVQGTTLENSRTENPADSAALANRWSPQMKLLLADAVHTRSRTQQVACYPPPAKNAYPTTASPNHEPGRREEFLSTHGLGLTQK